MIGMIINEIINKDLDQCSEAFKADNSLKELETEIYKVIAEVDDEQGNKIEEIFSAYTSRAIRIAYMQGIKDFRELFVTIKEDTNMVIEKMEREIVGDRERVSNID